MSNNEDSKMTLNDWFVVDGAFPTNYVVKSDIELFPKIKRLRELKMQAIESSRLHGPLLINGDL
jgi:hypothetical protein